MYNKKVMKVFLLFLFISNYTFKKSMKTYQNSPKKKFIFTKHTFQV